jgi:hypothetical protein
MRIYKAEEVINTLEEAGRPDLANLVRASGYKEFGYESYATFTEEKRSCPLCGGSCKIPSECPKFIPVSKK